MLKNEKKQTASPVDAVPAAIKKIHEFQRFGSVLGLERMNELLELLGNPQDDLKVIHVAGTNGKGSTCRYIYCVLKAAGYKVGLYISPFLEVFNERIEVDGRYISDEDLEGYTEKVLKQVEIMTSKGHDSPTEFEVITAIALLYYKEQACDYVVLEVGLGGRGDSTNVCKAPVVSVITSISFDHMDRLGNTLTEIAGEKAGIIKEGCPVVTSAEAKEALSVIRDAALAHHAPYYETWESSYQTVETCLRGSRFHVQLQEPISRRFENMEISMIGQHQIKNAIGALAALWVLEQRENILLPEEAIYRGMKEARQPGRLEVMDMTDEGPILLIDGAHNEDGARALKGAIDQLLPQKKILMAIGILADKDVDGVLRQFTAISKDFIVTEPDNPRRMEAEELAGRIEAMGGNCIIAKTPEEACQLAKEHGAKYDGIVFAGSLYLIGRIRTILRRQMRIC